MDVDVIEGRHFSHEDSENSLPVGITEKGFVDKMWPGESGIGKRIQLNPEQKKDELDSEWITIIGVVEHIDQGQAYSHFKGLSSLYRPISQQTPRWAHVVIKFNDKPDDFERIIKKSVSQVDRDTPIKRLRPMEEALFLNTKILQTLSELFVIIALIALILAGTGIYGVVSRTVLLRTHEMGIRRALGFSDSNTVNLFLKQGMAYLLIGAILGGGGALIASNLLTSEFPNLLNAIVGITVFISLLMTALVLIACYLPARKMIKMEPAQALHYE